jgi:iron complex transport system substrate-binding protein
LAVLRVGFVNLFVFFLLLALPTWARTLKDETGRLVVLSDHPHRIVCLAPSLTITVYALGHGNDVVGVTDYTTYPPEAKQKPSVGGGLTPSIEAIAALKPDLVLLFDTMTGTDTLRTLERVRIPVFVVTASGLEGAYRSVLSVGTALNDPAAAENLVRNLRSREQKVRQRMAGKPRPSVLLVVWPEPLVTAGRGAFITDLIEAAGARSVTADLSQPWPQVTLETIVPRQPKYLLLVRGSNVDVDRLQKLPGWSSLDAVRHRRVIWVDDRIYYASPSMLDALEDLSQQLVAAESH